MKVLLKNIYHRLKGTYLQVTPTVKLDAQWYGSKYGGFFVYPKLLTSRSVIYSFGIGQDISFDREIISKHQASVFGFDPTPKSLQWVNTQELPAGFTMRPFGISATSGWVDFYLPRNNDHVSGSLLTHKNVDGENVIKVQMKSLSDILEDFHHTHIDVLKMDIEGAEYDVIPELLKTSASIDQILIEFHHRMMSAGAKRTKHCIELLREAGYEIFAVSETGEEISFIKKEKASV